MKITIERGKRTYDVVPCGRRCSFAKKDGDGMTWGDRHCNAGCYLPQWYNKMVGACSVLDGAGLREIGGAKRSCKGCARPADQTCAFQCDNFRAAEVCKNFTPKKIGGAK